MGTESCCRPDYDALFDEDTARRERNDYLHRGTQGATRQLIEWIKAEGVDGADLLDIGGGVGVIGHELMAAGAARLTGVDLSHNYLAVAREEARDQGYADRADFRFGDFVELAPELADADVVTLDRVICCYANWRSLVHASTACARRLYGVIYPLDRPWFRAAAAVGNVVLRVMRSDWRFHIHPEQRIDALIRSAGFERVHRRKGLVWQTILYRRIGR